MSEVKTQLARLMFGACLFVACSDPGSDDARPTRTLVPAQVTASTPVATLALNVTNTFAVSGETFAGFELVAGARVELEVVTGDGSPLRFELLRLRGDGTADLVKAFRADSGFALTSVGVDERARFVLHFPAVAVTRDVVVRIACKSDGARCGPPQVDGQACAVAGDCVDGDVCYPNVGTCDAALMGGTCAHAIEAGSCAGDARAPVCGCDGTIYASACLARVAGVGLTTGCDASGANRAGASPGPGRADATP